MLVLASTLHCVGGLVRRLARSRLPAHPGGPHDAFGLPRLTFTRLRNCIGGVFLRSAACAADAGGQFGAAVVI